MLTRGREPGDDDGDEELVTLGDMRTMFELGAVAPKDSEGERAWRRAQAAINRKRAHDDAVVNLRARGILDTLLDAAAHERRECKLCGAFLFFVGPKGLPFTSDGTDHRAACPRTREQR